MLEQWSQQLAIRFGQAGIVAKEETAIYSYCFEVLLSNLAYYGTILVLSIALNQLPFMICYTCSFLVIRYTTGGYHAQTHLRCYLLSLAIDLMFLGLWCLIPWYAEVTVFCGWLVMVILWVIGPVEHENKPLSKEEMIGYRKKSRINSMMLAMLITVLCGFQQVEIAGIVLLALTSASLSAFAGQVMYKGRRRADEEVIV